MPFIDLRARSILAELTAHMSALRAVNTHSHHMPDSSFDDFSLQTLLNNSYVRTLGGTLDDLGAREAYLARVRHTAHFFWLERALKALYGLDELTADTWEQADEAVRVAHAKPGRHLRLLCEDCRYDRVVLDAHWEPGSDCGHPELFAPTLRVNPFFFGYAEDAADHNGNHAPTGRQVGDIDLYCDRVRTVIVQKKTSGCVALKSALAYDRGLDFTETSKEAAQRAFRADRTSADIKAFQDYVFFAICRVAAELKLPFQNHTGLGKFRRTGAMQLHEVIDKNPDTTFVLFHGGYPFLDDVCGLAHNYSNVFPDLCQLPLISTGAAKRMLESLVDVCLSDRICWGCDTQTSEESYGALLAVRHTLARALSAMVEEGRLGISDAKVIAEDILAGNAEKLYGGQPSKAVKELAVL